jgi:hypothetical protein
LALLIKAAFAVHRPLHDDPLTEVVAIKLMTRRHEGITVAFNVIAESAETNFPIVGAWVP